jgi:hypothetical protein
MLWADYLGDMLLSADVDTGEVHTTTFTGKAPDLAAFIGMLSWLADYGFPVIECEYHQINVEDQLTNQ